MLTTDITLNPTKKLKPLPKNKAWFTSNTELLTNAGWVQIEEAIRRNLPLLTYSSESNSIQPRNILTSATMAYKGDVQFFEYPDIYMEFRYAFPLPKSEFLKSHESLERNIFGTKPYDGTLFNVSVPNSTVFVRHPNTKHPGQSILAKTYVVMEADDILDDGYQFEEDNNEGGEDEGIFPITNILETGYFPKDKDFTKKRGGNDKHPKNPKYPDEEKRRFGPLTHPNYYLCKVSW